MLQPMGKGRVVKMLYPQTSNTGSHLTSNQWYMAANWLETDND